ncbi:hypothetical protein BFU36_09795 [Sulfolobus sp. A20]|uniref:hypothetical protein n=1 Tax=Sulfolobaceae TaxID=118883 RepID=UPI0008460688|nr:MULTISPECIES: hypothetical protein [unclassified Sulfolobus]TRM73744.1 hypothetical protein DJ532_14440 [Sulfolobus sp. A20-N-F8]TRM76060.1 hypothetical protein DJ523_01860 [Sulfolobus sp. E5]TRM81084.1 hypothetical protein DJ524_05310 [Sulfolobus sp. D5]TRM86334.1 hypothetical protein DJ529_11555 [Sulfolobus sp. C3]TRM93693.1 hypothetical protein DJ526_03105 [Sulfolobus sp. A20-N-G8]
MKLRELINELTDLEQELDFDKLKEEDYQLSKLIEQLEKSKESIENSLKLVKVLEDKSKDIVSNDFIKGLNEVKTLISEISNTNDPTRIIILASDIKNRLEILEREINNELNRLISEKIKNINEINNKLGIFARVLVQFLRLPVEVKTFPVPSDRSISKLSEIERQAIRYLEDIRKLTIERINENNENISLSPSELDLLLELLEKGEVKINRNNLESIYKVIKILTERGITIQVRF